MLVFDCGVYWYGGNLWKGFAASTRELDEACPDRTNPYSLYHPTEDER